MDNLKQLQCEDAKEWVNEWAAAFGMAERQFGLSEAVANSTINSHVAPVFEKLILSVAKRVPPDSRNVVDGSTDPTSVLPRLTYVAYSMLNFSAHHFAFVLDSFHNQRYFMIEPPPPPKPAPGVLYAFGPTDVSDLVTIPPGFANYALRGVLGKISSDIMTLHTIWNQYTSDQPDSVRAGLARNNNLAADYLRRLQRFLSDVSDVAPPIVYVRPSTGTRLMPYSNVPLIAIPPSAVINPIDSMAIPHELGHFLFWRGRLNGKRLWKAVSDALTQPEGTSHLCRHWLEEIFADVIAALIGGPRAVESLMDLQQEKIGSLFTRDDGHYPIPAVRPYAALAVLSRAGGVDIEPLQTRWSQVLAAWLNVAPQNVPNAMLQLQPDKTPNTPPQHTLNDIQADLTQIADKILDVLLGSGQPIPADFTAGWGTADSSIGVDGSSTIQSQEQDPLAELKWTSTVRADLWTDPASAALDAAPFGSIDWVIDVLELRTGGDAGSAAAGSTPLKVPQEKWMDILYFGGWGDAGPTGGSPHEFD